MSVLDFLSCVRFGLCCINYHTLADASRTHLVRADTLEGSSLFLNLVELLHGHEGSGTGIFTPHQGSTIWVGQRDRIVASEELLDIC